MKSNVLAAAGIAATVSACATPPDKIKPIDLPNNAYMSRSCGEIAGEKATLQARVKGLSEHQATAAKNDAWGVFMLGVPVYSMTGGDRGKDLAVAKGQLGAADRALKQKGC